jgi:hypothetical protein
MVSNDAKGCIKGLLECLASSERTAKQAVFLKQYLLGAPQMRPCCDEEWH